MHTLDGNMDDATYGTRSRQRAGNGRPNYAEDQEMDFEYTSAATTGKRKAANVSAAQNPVAGQTGRANETTRTMTGTPKGSTPVPANAAAPTSKKRKAAGAMPPVQQGQTPPTSVAPGPVANRRPAVAGASTAGRETNVMTFMKARNCLNKKGELVADDGTKLAINGKPDPANASLFEVAALPRASCETTQRDPR